MLFICFKGWCYCANSIPLPEFSLLRWKNNRVRYSWWFTNNFHPFDGYVQSSWGLFCSMNWDHSTIKQETLLFFSSTPSVRILHDADLCRGRYKWDQIGEEWYILEGALAKSENTRVAKYPSSLLSVMILTFTTLLLFPQLLHIHNKNFGKICEELGICMGYQSVWC